jgi:hypothetical protein
MPVRLDEITQIKESFNQDEVNSFLSKGFKLLKILSSKTISNEMDEIRPIYVLGLTKIDP